MSDPRTRLDRALRVFADVRRGEGRRTLLLAANLFILLLAYYLLKTVREPLVLGENGGGAEIKSYAAAFQALLLVGLASGFGWLAGRFERRRLITIVTCFFVANLVLFWAALTFAPSVRLPMGVAFFIWVGCFNVLVIAQFWSFAADLHQREAGERLFPIIGGGSAIGAVVGARVAKPLFNLVGPYAMLLIAGGLLLVAVVLTWLVDARTRQAEEPPVEGRGGFALLLGDRYLQLVAAVTLLKNWVNTTGEYILDRRLVDVAHARFGTQVQAVEKFIAGFKSDYFTYANVLVLLLQLFAVARIIKYLGVRRSLFILPCLALFSYGSMAAAPLLMVIFVGKIAENSADYSVQKTAEQALFLVTSREAKYKAKAVIDTVVVRSGDVLSALLVWTGTRWGLSTVGFIVANMVLVGLWLGVVWRLSLAHRTACNEAPQPVLEPELVPT
jgi:AAA family ATP:ADP antiporter